MYLRRCLMEDSDTLYKWANDPTVRINAFNTSPIPYEEHVEWFKKSIENKDRQIFILIKDNISVGQIRIDIEENIAIISYIIDEKERGKGIGSTMLNLLYEKIKADGFNIKILKGLVKKENIASRKAFINNGYIEIEDKEYIVYIKKIE